MKKPTEKQIETLREIGVAETPATRAEAQSLIARHFRPKSKRGRRQRERNRYAKDAAQSPGQEGTKSPPSE